MWLALLAAGAATIGTNVHVPAADTLDLAVDLGGAWIRIDLNWDLAEPAEGQWNWAPFDAAIAGAHARGLRIYATLGYTPAWASTGNRLGDGHHNDVPIAAKYRTFVETAVARYKMSVDVFGTWNEPNLAGFFEGSRDEWLASVYRPALRKNVDAGYKLCTDCGAELPHDPDRVPRRLLGEHLGKDAVSDFYRARYTDERLKNQPLVMRLLFDSTAKTAFLAEALRLSERRHDKIKIVDFDGSDVVDLYDERAGMVFFVDEGVTFDELVKFLTAERC